MSDINKIINTLQQKTGTKFESLKNLYFAYKEQFPNDSKVLEPLKVLAFSEKEPLSETIDYTLENLRD